MFAVAVAAACSSGSPFSSASSGQTADAGSGCAPTLSSIAATVFTPTCVKSVCHDAASRAAGLDLGASDLAAQLVDVPSGTCSAWIRVVPGSPDKSLLWQKIAGTPPCGASMPFGGSPLPNAQKACIREWIAGLPPSGGGAADSGGDASSDASGDASADAGDAGCPSAEALCSGACVDTSTDSSDCGGCGKTCPTGASCVASACVCPATASTVCGGACVDLQSDGQDCGSCGTVCVSGTVCNLGACTMTCGSLTLCGTSCVDTSTNFDDCGGCGIVCPSGATCTGGTCVCPSGESACSGACINTSSDPNDCGGCGVTCSGGTSCSGGKCVCPSGETLCSGACVDTSTDSNDCGGCGIVCVTGETCTSGKCACGSASISFSGAVQPIFTANCALAGCHSGVTPQEGMNLSAGQAYSNIVDVPAKECTDGRLRVKPSDATNSYVVQKLTNVDLCSGTQMPKTGGALPSSEIDTIVNWICEGAPNN